jgi:hypothetical protein
MDKILKICNRLHNKQFLYKLAQLEVEEPENDLNKILEDVKYLIDSEDELETESLNTELEDLITGINEKLVLLRREIVEGESFENKKDALDILDLAEQYLNKRDILGVSSAIFGITREFTYKFYDSMSESSIEKIEDIVHDLERVKDILENNSMIDSDINPDQISSEYLDPTNIDLNPEVNIEDEIDHDAIRYPD